MVMAGVRSAKKTFSRWVFAVLFAGALVLAPMAGASATEFVWSYVGPDTLKGVAAELESGARWVDQLERAVGPSPIRDPIRVELHAESSPVAESTPGWIAGFAQGSLGRVVLFPERVPRYPNGSLDEVFRHELVHVFVARAAAGKPVPRWFNEGLSTSVAGSWSFGDRSRLTWALLFRGRHEITELDPLFLDGSTAPKAYAISAAFVRDLTRRYGESVAPRILAEVSRGESFERAFTIATGTTIRRAEDRFWGTHSILYRWIPVLSSSFTLWIAITLLFLVAAGRRRQRDARVREAWAAQEQSLEDLSAEDVEVIRPSSPRNEWIH